MSRLPAPEDYGVTTPRPSRQITEIQPVEGRPDLATGKAMQDIGLMMQQEAEKLDETVALDALNQLQNKQLELTYGDNGFTKVQGKGVIDQKITSAFPTQLQTEMDRLAGTINSAQAKQKFQTQAGGVLRHFKASVYTHAAKETEQFQVQAFKGAVDTAVKAAEQGAYADGISNVLPVIEAEIARQGMGADAADQLRREALGPVYSAGIRQLLTSGRSVEAKGLLENAKAWMTPKEVDHFSSMVKTQSDYDLAGQLVDEARLRNLTPEQAYDMFREKGAGSKEVVETARGQFEHYVALQKAKEAESAAPLMLDFLNAGGNFASKASVVKSAAFIGAKPEVQVKVLDYMENHAKAALAFGQHQEAYWENKKATDPEVLIAFSNVAGSPETLVQYTDQQLLVSMLPVLGKTRTADLIKYKHQVAAESQKFHIPKDLIEQAMPPNLQKPVNAVEKQQKQRFEGLVTESLMDWKLANPGKHPDKNEQFGIIESAARQLKAPGVIFGTNDYPAYAFKPIPTDFEQAVQSKMLAEKGRRATTTELQNLWAQQKDARIK